MVGDDLGRDDASAERANWYLRREWPPPVRQCRNRDPLFLLGLFNGCSFYLSDSGRASALAAQSKKASVRQEVKR
jgi:hypothetical protein